MANKNEESNDDDDDEEVLEPGEAAQALEADFDENSPVESLLRALAVQRSIISQRDETIHALKVDLVREKKMNDVLLDQIILMKTSPSLPLDLNSSSSTDGNSVPFSQPITPGQGRQHSEKVEQNPTDDITGSGVEGDREVNEKDSTSKPQDDLGREDDEDDDDDGKLAEIHPRCSNPAQKLAYILNAFKNLPANRSTILIGASNYHCIKGELDPVKKNTVVRSISGLCTVGAAKALCHYEHTYPRIKKLVWSLGVNDQLHENEHCPGEWNKHFSILIRETKRIFCNAKIHFIVPFSGLPRVPPKYSEKIWDLLQSKFPEVKRHRAPSMEGKVQRDGIHIDNEGAKTLRRFLVKRFTTYKPWKSVSDQQPNNSVHPPRGNANNMPRENGHNVRNSDGESGNRLPGRPPTSFNNEIREMGSSREYENAHFPPLQVNAQSHSAPRGMFRGQQQDPIRELSEMLASALYVHMNRRM